MADQNAQKVQELEIKRRHVYNSQFTQQKLKDRVEILERENNRLKSDYDRFKENYDKERRDLESIIELLSKESKKEKDSNYFLDTDLQRKQGENKDLQEEFNRTYEGMVKKQEEERYYLQDKIKMLEQEVDKNLSQIHLREKIEGERQDLIEQLANEKQERMRELADKEREKVQATDKLKKDMFHKIEETKVSLMALKKEQIATTNRLTVLQNHQLTTELEYQSKQTEKLLFKNSKLQDQIQSLKRDVEIHKQVEQELAKRSHQSQKKIKRLSQMIKEKEERNENYKKQLEQDKEPFEIQNFNLRKKDEIAKSLEKHCDTSEKRIAKIQNDIEILKNENFYLQSRLDNSDNRVTNLAQVLAHNLESFKNKTSGLFDELSPNDSDLIGVDQERLRNQDVMDWSDLERYKVFELLINKIRTLLSKRNLMISQNDPKSLNINIVGLEAQQGQKSIKDDFQLPRIGFNNNNNQNAGIERTSSGKKFVNGERFGKGSSSLENQSNRQRYEN